MVPLSPKRSLAQLRPPPTPLPPIPLRHLLKINPDGVGRRTPKERGLQAALPAASNMELNIHGPQPIPIPPR